MPYTIWTLDTNVNSTTYGTLIQVYSGTASTLSEEICLKGNGTCYLIQVTDPNNPMDPNAVVACMTFELKCE